ncbi:MAG: kelch repeat-containing protein, partial [Acidobacteriota bacterium]
MSPFRTPAALRARWFPVLAVVGLTAVVLLPAPTRAESPPIETTVPATAGAWFPTGSMTHYRSEGATSTLLLSGEVLVVDFAGDGTAELYDPRTGTWSFTQAPSTPRSGHTATLLPDGRVLVVGGDAAGTCGECVELYDPDTGTWSPAASLAMPRDRHTAPTPPTIKTWP